MVLSNDKQVLAVGRENHSIEIWKADTFAQLLVLGGNRNVDMRNIHWIEPEASLHKADPNLLYYKREGKRVEIKKRRLITTGLNGMVIEWDL
mmetsp:Transcript_4019/g.6029  ORF Transcript_4019/g.6029 Transcript_4019/m.6029 type:complete len:92 (-) Transcript_4019:295-570(-)